MDSAIRPSYNRPLDTDLVLLMCFRFEKKLVETKEEYLALQRQENEQKKRRAERVRDNAFLSVRKHLEYFQSFLNSAVDL